MSDDMTWEKFQHIGRAMIADARERFRQEAYALCGTTEQRAKVDAIAPAIGEVSPEEAVLAFKRWLLEASPPDGTPEAKS